MHKKAFTLIELLIVVAIIAILAAIAVPNFLEAQARAKISRAQADLRTVLTAATTYLVDNGKIFPDTNDTDTPAYLRGMTFSKENPSAARDVKYANNDDMWFDGFYVFGVFSPLTTPIAYMNTPAKDPFSRTMPIGIDTREINNSIAYAVLFISGPDVTDGDWFRGANPSGKSLPYDATNGTKSRGDIWRSVQVKDMVVYKQEYGETVF